MAQIYSKYMLRSFSRQKLNIIWGGRWGCVAAPQSGCAGYRGRVAGADRAKRLDGQSGHHAVPQPQGHQPGDTVYLVLSGGAKERAAGVDGIARCGSDPDPGDDGDAGCDDQGGDQAVITHGSGPSDFTVAML